MNLTVTFARSKILLMEKLTNGHDGALVTPDCRKESNRKKSNGKK